jgi:hypothetical protein
MDARGPAIDVSNSDGGRCRTCRQQPPEGPPSTSPTPMVATAGPAASTPQGARHQRLQLWWWPLPDLPPAPPRGPPSTSPTPVVAAAGLAASNPQGGHHRRFAKLGTCRQNFSGDTYYGDHRGKHYHYKQATWRKNGGKSLAKKNFGSLRCQELRSHNTITELKFKSTNSATTLSIIGITERGGKATAGRMVYASSGSRSNRSTTAQAASSTPSMLASADPSTVPCTTGSRETHQHVVSHRLC